MVRCALAYRILMSAIIALAWNVTTTHCAFAAATASVTPASSEDANECPMHAAKKTPKPEKKKGCADVPCCKNLPAAKPVSPVFACKLMPVLSIGDYLSSTPPQLELAPPVSHTEKLDTGPPSFDSFTELVLRRSIPAHAPPRS